MGEDQVLLIVILLLFSAISAAKTFPGPRFSDDQTGRTRSVALKQSLASEVCNPKLPPPSKVIWASAPVSRLPPPSRVETQPAHPGTD